ncbi:MAG TPA: hypothetical protein DEG74_06085 [Clostridiales bacterium]|nr:hypothetical protein [Clostridiales bacterium]
MGKRLHCPPKFTQFYISPKKTFQRKAFKMILAAINKVITHAYFANTSFLFFRSNNIAGMIRRASITDIHKMQFMAFF